jgi:hypothetical protein
MRLIKSILSCVLAVLVLTAGSHFYVGIHHCGKTVKEITFLKQADGCGHAQMPPCHRVLMKACCEDETIQHEAQDFKLYPQKHDLKSQPFITLEQPAQIISEIIPSSDILDLKFIQYDPPLRVTDVTVDLQVFLI